jgi:Mg-chelatase subunit ChlD
VSGAAVSSVRPGTAADPAIQDPAVRELERLVRDRPVLRAGFDQAWPRLASGAAAPEADWARATLELSRVNAGPACIAAFWRAGAAAGARDGRAALVGGVAAAEICRFAGARAALACLETLPAAIRLTAGNPAGLAAWRRGLIRLAREAPGVVRGTAERVESLLRDGDGLAFLDFVAAGLKATARDRARRVAFFALDDPLAREMLARRAGAPGFASCERMLRGFVTGLWGGEPRLIAGPIEEAGSSRRTMIAAGTVVLPPMFPGVPAGQTRAQYRAAAAHAQAHLAIPAPGQDVAQLRPLQIAIVGLIEDARVEALAIRRFPGLRRLWARFHVARPGGPQTAVNLMARLARALLDPGYADEDGFVAKGRALFAAASDRLDDPAFSRAIGALLGNDLGQMRVQFNAKTYVVEPAYRDDNAHLWTLEAPDDAMRLPVDAVRPSQGGGTSAPRARPMGPDDRGVALATYPEWDSAAGVERPDWTTLRDATPRLGVPEPEAEGETALRARIARLVRGGVVGRRARRPRQEDGEELDFDAALAAAIALRAGLPPDPRVYRDRRPRKGDLATLVILDVSQSTAAIGASGRSVLDSQRRAVAALATALEANGDRFALRAFASSGREDVRLIRLKEFDEPWGEITQARLAGLIPGLSTRLGAAIRHAGAELAPVRAARKLILVLTDGEPSDIDVADPTELVEDARRAARALRPRGIEVFGIVMDPEDAGSAAAIFGRRNAMPVRRLEELPHRLAGVYFRLAQR